MIKKYPKVYEGKFKYKIKQKKIQRTQEQKSRYTCRLQTEKGGWGKIALSNYDQLSL